ncbi:MAG: DUF4900 domain-containing protein [Candidatus Methylomirabilales bacterium]
MTPGVGQRRRERERGAVLIVAVVFTALVAVGSIVAVSGTLEAVRSSASQLRDKRAFFGAEGSAALCKGELRNRLLVALPAQMKQLASIATITNSIYTPNDPARLLVDYAYNAATSLGGRFIRDSATQAHLRLEYAAPGASNRYDCTLTLISRKEPAVINVTPPVYAPADPDHDDPTYLFRYAYTITGAVTDGSTTRQVALDGAVDITLQTDNFARYALLTNQQTSGGGEVWFTNRTSFSGPVHTNGKFNFANNPSGRFTDVVTSVNSQARFYNNGRPRDDDADRNGDLDVPVFENGFSRSAENIPMPTGTSANRQVEKALGMADGALGDGAFPSMSTGVHLGVSGDAMTGGIYVNTGTSGGTNPASVTLAGGSTATYSITIGGATTTVTANPSARTTTLRAPNGTTTTYAGLPNGMLFVNGRVGSLSGTLQRDTQVTIAATNDVVITNNVVYENYTGGATPSAEGTSNLLGLMSWSGNVRIGTSAPNDVSVHATVMTPTGEFRVDSYNSGSARGTATVLGGVIENTYGPFGTFGSGTTGYGRNFVFDTRMRRGMWPPFFPKISRVATTVTGLNDRPNWQQPD